MVSREFRLAERAAQRDLKALGRYGVTAERRALHLDRIAAAIGLMQLNVPDGTDADRSAEGLILAVRTLARFERGATVELVSDAPGARALVDLRSMSARERTRRVSGFLRGVLTELPGRDPEFEGLAHEVACAYGRLTQGVVSA